MTENAKINSEPKKKSKAKRFFKYFLYFALFGALALSLALIGLASSHTFRQWALGYVTKVVNNELIGKIELGDIDFLSWHGIVISDARLLAAGDTVAYVKKIEVDLRFEGLLDENITINKVHLDGARIKILRNTYDSTWNVNKIAKPAPEKPKKESKLKIYIADLKLNDGAFYMIDSLGWMAPTGRFTPSRMLFEKVNVDLSANLNVGQNEYAAKIKNISLYDRQSQTEASRLTMDASLNKLGISAENTILEIDGSKAEFTAKMENYYPMGTDAQRDINNTVFDFKFKGTDLNPKIMYKFADVPLKICGTFDTKITARGTLNDLRIKKIELNTNKTDIKLSGNISDILKGAVKYELELDGTKLGYEDMLSTLPEINLKSVPNFETAKFKKLYINGSTDSVLASMDIYTDIGSVSGDIGCGFGNSRLNYSFSAIIDALDMAPILKNNDYRSSINGYAEIKGSGSDINKMGLFVKLKTTESYFAKYNLKSADFQAFYRGGDTLAIDTLRAVVIKPDFIADDYYKDPYSIIDLAGGANVRDWKHLKYNFIANFKSADMAYLLNIPAAPKLFSGSVKTSASGIELDSLEGTMQIDVKESLFLNKALFPFTVKATAKRSAEGKRELRFRSDFFNISAVGNYVPTQLISSLQNQGLYLSNFVKEKIGIISPEIKDLKTEAPGVTPKKASYDPIDCAIRIRIKDFSPLAMFIDKFNVNVKAVIAADLIQKGTESRFIFDTIRVDKFEMKSGLTVVKAEKINGTGIMNIDLKDSLPDFSFFNIDIASAGDVNYDALTFNKPATNISFDGSTADFKTSSGINSIFAFMGAGKVEIEPSKLGITIDSTDFKYNGQFRWQTSAPIRAEIGDKGIVVNSFRIGRLGAERIEMTGLVKDNIAHDLALKIYDFRLSDILPLLPAPNRKQLQSFSGKLDSLGISVNGDLKSPEIKLNLYAKDINFNKFYIGKIGAEFTHENGVIHGFAKVYTDDNNKYSEEVLLEAESVPFKIGLDSAANVFDPTKFFLVKVTAPKLPLQIISPFVPNVYDIAGTAVGELELSGYAPKELSYKGGFKIQNASLLLGPNNMNYNAAGYIKLENNNAILENVKLYNVASDLKNGSAEVNGTVGIDNFNIGALDLHIKSQGLMLLNAASMKTMPNMYGPFVMATEGRHLRFHGTLAEPNLDGDVIVKSAELTMPEYNGKQASRTTFNYEVHGNKTVYKIKTIPNDSIKTTNTNPDNAPKQEGVNIADLINYDLNIRIVRFTSRIDFGALGEVFAIIGTRDPSVPIHYVKTRNSQAHKLYSGELELKQGSRLKMYQIMDTKGSISFPTGSIENPTLNLQATCDGKTIDGAKTYQVKALITGTKLVPILNLTYSLNGSEASGDPSKIQEEAFYLLATKNLKSSFLDQNKNVNIVGQGSTVMSQFASQIASKSLTDLLLGTGIIQSADVKFNGEGFQNAQVNLSGSLFGVANWSIGGTLADLSTNNDITLEIPISLKSKELTNFIFQFSKSTNINATTQMSDAKDFEVKLKIGGSY